MLLDSFMFYFPLLSLSLDGCSVPFIFSFVHCSEDDGSISDQQEDLNCPICLLPFTGQDIGTPESCDHGFCLACIQEWAKVHPININISGVTVNIIVTAIHKGIIPYYLPSKLRSIANCYQQLYWYAY